MEIVSKIEGWITIDAIGVVSFFNVKPEPVYVPVFKHNKWATRNGTTMMLNNEMFSERYLDEKGNVQHRMLVDMLGLKRKGRNRHGVMQYEGLKEKEPLKVEMEIRLKY